MNFLNHSNPRDIQVNDKPTNLHHAKIYNMGQQIILHRAAPVTKSSRVGTTQQPPVEDKWGIQTQLEGNKDILIKAIRQGVALAVSDGSFQTQARVAAWMIESSTKENRIVGHGRTPRSAMDQSAYQSKLFGLWGIIYTLTQLTKNTT